ncbi:DegT/DnrJ/EryC1/StrS family aminotransferase [Nitrospirota bacterium]
MIQMLNLKKQYEGIRKEVEEAVTSVLESTAYILGPRVKEFEAKVAEYVGVRDGIGVASGTDALHLSIKALGIGEGDEVITTPFTFFATTEAILYERAIPVFVDIDPETYCMDVSKIEERITERTKAILPVHMFGHPADMKTIMDIADKHGLMVIEDCAQSIGAHIEGKKTGSFGNTGCFSFYPSKNLGAFGDGGLITLNDREVAESILKFRNHGSSGGYLHEVVGINSRLDELQAAILLVKLKRIDEYNKLRRQRAATYTSLMKDKVKCPVERAGCYHVYHQYTIRHPERDRIKGKLAKEGIASNVFYPIPVHLQPALADMGMKKGSMPEAEKASDEVLSLPMFPELDESSVETIAAIISGV